MKNADISESLMLTCYLFRDLTVSIPPSASHHTFSFGIVHQSQTSNTTCTGTSEEGITCKDSAYKIEVDAAATSMSFRLYLILSTDFANFCAFFFSPYHLREAVPDWRDRSSWWKHHPRHDMRHQR